MHTIIFMFLGGMLVKADGWGPASSEEAAKWPSWQLAIATFFNSWRSAIIFAFLALGSNFNLSVALAAGLAFFIWRAPGFNGWEKWWHMYWRGLWTSAIGFTLLSYAARGNADHAWLCLLMGGFEALSYSGAYKWQRGRPDWVIQSTAEISSGALFTFMVAIIIGP